MSDDEEDAFVSSDHQKSFDDDPSDCSVSLPSDDGSSSEEECSDLSDENGIERELLSSPAASGEDEDDDNSDARSTTKRRPSTAHDLLLRDGTFSNPSAFDDDDNDGGGGGCKSYDRIGSPYVKYMTHYGLQRVDTFGGDPVAHFFRSLQEMRARSVQVKHPLGCHSE